MISIIIVFSMFSLLYCRRQASEGRHDKADHGRQGSQESATVSAKVNAEFVSSLQV